MYLIYKGDELVYSGEAGSEQDAYLQYAENLYPEEEITCLLLDPTGLCERTSYPVRGACPLNLHWSSLKDSEYSPQTPVGWGVEEGVWWANEVNEFTLFVPVEMEEEISYVDAEMIGNNVWAIEGGGSSELVFRGFDGKWKRQKYTMTWEDAYEEFVDSILQDVQEIYEGRGVRDVPARSEAWSIFVDSLHRSGDITEWQASNWPTPSICNMQK